MLALADEPGGEGGPPCAARVEAKATAKMIKNFEELSLDELVEHWSIEDYIDFNYPKGTEIIDPYSKKVFDTQVGPSCNAMSVNYSVYKKTGRRVTQGEAHKIIDNIMWEDFLAKDRRLADLTSGAGILHGYDQKAIRRYLRAMGARVAELPPILNRNVKLRHLQALLAQGWNVKLILEFGAQAGQHAYHAIIVDGLVVNAKGAITAVRIYDPNVGRLMKVPARGFRDMIARGVPYGTVTAFRWD